jgi:hypothetical protein
MNQPAILAALILVGSAQVVAQTNPAGPGQAEDYSGMYMFLRDGEFVQITVEDEGRVTGFVSRYGDSESDRGVFLNQFFKEGKLDGTQLSFVTQVVHGVWFEFKGRVARGPGKTLQEEAYYVLEGTLIESRSTDKKVSSTSRQVTFKSFPRYKETSGRPAYDSIPPWELRLREGLQQLSCSRLSFRPLRLPSTVTAIDSV